MATATTTPQQPTTFAGLADAFMDARDNGRLRVLRTPVTGARLQEMMPETGGAFQSAFAAMATLETGLTPDRSIEVTAMSDYHWMHPTPAMASDFEALAAYVTGTARRRR